MAGGWKFYGRGEERQRLGEILSRGHFFFLKLSGRRRIGKTSLIREALTTLGRGQVLYLQIPDADPAGVVSAARDFYDMFGLDPSSVQDLRGLAVTVSDLMRRGWVVAMDEFQYFHRTTLFEFTSFLQLEVDRLLSQAHEVAGGLIVLGSIHTELSALLEDRSAPLFNRITDSMELGHLDISSVLEILRAHATADPERLLFLWNLFEGIPKFYRDCFEQGALGAPRQELLRRMFFSSSSPLRAEADNWFLRELRGRYDAILKYIARHPGCSTGDLDNHLRSVEPSAAQKSTAYLRVLKERYGMVELLQPVFAQRGARQGRLYLRDNFLRSWLAALATPVASLPFRPLAALVEEADSRLRDAEGHGLERLVGVLYEERSRKGLEGFSLTSRVQGYWDRKDTEIDLVALDEERECVRLGTCKRSAERLGPDLPRFDGHVERFLAAMPRLKGWRVEKVAIAPEHTEATRARCEDAGYICQDLNDLTRGL